MRDKVIGKMDASDEFEEFGMPQISDETRAMSDGELLDALDATRTIHVHILPPKSVHDELRTRAAEESAFPVDGKYVRIANGELLAFMWRYFLDTYGPSTGEVARFVAQYRADYAERRAEAIHRGLVEPTDAEARVARASSSDDDQADDQADE